MANRHIAEPAPLSLVRTRTARPPSLPAQPTSLIGRDRDVEHVRALLLRPEVRLVTLTGPAGVGKTRLALEVATGLLGAFEDEVRFIDLAPVSDPALLVPSITAALGGREALAQAPIERLVEIARDERLLLVLDNFEQILAAAGDLAELLAACPEVKLLVTSRTALHLRWEHRVIVAPLALPAIGDKVQVAGYRGAVPSPEFRVPSSGRWRRGAERRRGMG